MTKPDRYQTGDLIPDGDLIRTYILHLRFPNEQRDSQWYAEETLMRATLNQQSTIIPKLPGLPIETTIEVNYG